AGAMPAQIEPLGINGLLTGQIIGGGQNVVDLAEKSLLDSRIVVSAAKRGKHQDDSLLAVRAGGLVVGGWGRGPGAPLDRVAIAAGNPDDRGALLTVRGCSADVGRKLAGRGLIEDLPEQVWRGLRDGLTLARRRHDLGLETAPRVAQRTP